MNVDDYIWNTPLVIWKKNKADLLELARAKHAQSRFNQVGQVGDRLSLNQDWQILPGTYEGYRNGRHWAKTVLGIFAIDAFLSDGGLMGGDPLILYKDLDTQRIAANYKPHTRPNPRPSFTPGEPEPQISVLIRKKALKRIDEVFHPATPDIYSEPIPELRYKLYWASALTDKPTGWDAAATPRYFFARSYQRDVGLWVYSGFEDWLATPPNTDELFLRGPWEDNYTNINFLYDQITPDTVEAVGADVIVGRYILEGENPPLPQIYFREYSSPNAPVNTTPENLEWELLEDILVRPYQPPELIYPAQDAYTELVPVYETQFWIGRSNGSPIKVFTTDYSGGIGQSVWARVSISPDGKSHADFKLPNATLKHFQVLGEEVTEVQLSESWRKSLANSLPDDFVVGPDSHICISQYLDSPWINLDPDQQQLFQIRESPKLEYPIPLEQIVTIAKLMADEGLNLSLQIYPFQSEGSSCTIDLTTSAEEEQIFIPQLQGFAINSGANYQESAIVVGFAGGMVD
ncbi:MAG TPA: hypothetical protein V6D10_07050 [Trichocoleus sp.]|jgi:hypothetical protein